MTETIGLAPMAPLEAREAQGRRLCSMDMMEANEFAKWLVSDGRAVLRGSAERRSASMNGRVIRR